MPARADDACAAGAGGDATPFSHPRDDLTPSFLSPRRATDGRRVRALAHARSRSLAHRPTDDDADDVTTRRSVS